MRIAIVHVSIGIDIGRGLSRDDILNSKSNVNSCLMRTN